MTSAASSSSSYPYYFRSCSDSDEFEYSETDSLDGFVVSDSELITEYSDTDTSSDDEDEDLASERPNRKRKAPDRLGFEPVDLRSPAPKRMKWIIPRRFGVSPFNPSSIRNLTDELKAHKKCPVLAREKEVGQLVAMLADASLGMRPLLTGLSGIGKTAVVRKFAWEIAHDKAFEVFKGRSVVMINCQTFIGTQVNPAERELLAVTFKGMLERQFNKDPCTIFFLKNINLILKNDILKNYFHAIAQNRWSLIGSVDGGGGDKVVKKSKQALMRYRFTPVKVSSFDDKVLTDVVTYKIANKSICDKKIAISGPDIRFAIYLSKKYLLQLPCHLAAIRTIRQAGAHKLLEGAPEVKVDRPALAEVVASYASRSPEELLYTGRQEVMMLKQKLMGRVVGQDHAIKTICDYVSDFKDGRCDPTKPPGVFMFAGPTGVGKTELAKALAEYLYHDSNCFIRQDMSEFMTRDSVSRMIGADPGYIGYESGGSLVQAVKEKPHSVLLLDEGEKAHPDVWNVFLQVFEDGRLTDGKSTTADFTNTFIFITTNLTQEGICASLRPELINRLDEVITFQPIQKRDYRKIVDVQLNRLKETYWSSKRRQLSWTPIVTKCLVQVDFNPSFGARDFCRSIAREVKAALREIDGEDEDVLEGKVLLDVKRRRLVATKI